MKFLNLGFISKKKIAREIAKLYNGCKGGQEARSREELLQSWEVQSNLNVLCDRLKIKPDHRNTLGRGTGKMLVDNCNGCMGASNNDCGECTRVYK